MAATIIADSLKKFGGLALLNDEEKADLIRQFRMVRGGSSSKYNAMTVEYQGEIFHSLSEAYYYYLLQRMRDKGQIVHIRRQVSYPLEDMEGNKRLRYISDFEIMTPSCRQYVIDVKGYFTSENKIKLSYWYYVYKKPLYIVYIKGPMKFDTSFII